MTEDILQAVADLQRRIATIIRVGHVVAVDYDHALIRVRIGQSITTDWSPWLSRRAAADADWWAPELGEQVLVLAIESDSAQSIILPALYSSDGKPPATASHLHRQRYADGTIIEYDRQLHQHSISIGQALIKADRNQIVLQVGSTSLTVNSAGIRLGGDVASFGAFANNDINISSDHTHSDVVAGPDSTGAPE